MTQAAPLLCCLFLLTLPTFPQQAAQLLRARTGTVHLPPGRISVDSEIRLPVGAHDLTIIGEHTVLAASDRFHGRALLSCRRCRNLTIRNLAFDGNRKALEKARPLPPTDLPFSRFYPDNGILVEDSDGLSMDHVDLADITNFPVLVSRSRHVSLEHLAVKNSGSRNAKGRNNTTGGILLEQGTEDFRVANSVFQDIRGNALWTHSCYQSPRNLRGKFATNRFSDIGRDAIQVGHASEVTVMGNTGQRIGMHLPEVDVEGGGTPVGIDTAGNVDRSTYENNEFSEINGKCIDLDGFHDGTVRGNKCSNHGQPEDYAYGNFGIAFNNTSIEMQSRNILVEENTLDGMKFGGIFVIGSGHRIRGNIMRRLNLAHCNETHLKFGCIQILDEPGFLESGIYLGKGAGRPDPARQNIIENNVISGWKMAQDCVRSAPGIALTGNQIRGNHCSDE